MTKLEFKQQLDRLSLAFEKKMSTDLMDLWWEECRTFPLESVRKAAQHFLESDQKTFPRIGEFKTALRGASERRTPEGTQTLPFSCPRCSHGFCSVKRFSGDRKHSFAFRCSCPAGDGYPGLPLVPSDERTLKESQERPNYPVPSPQEQRRITQEFFDILEEIPF